MNNGDVFEEQIHHWSDTNEFDGTKVVQVSKTERLYKTDDEVTIEYVYDALGKNKPTKKKEYI